MEHTKFIKNKLNDIFKHLSIKPELEVQEEGDSTKISISGNDLSFLIGFHGESLSALQNLLNSMIFKEFNVAKNVALDINNYRSSKMERTEELVKRSIDKVRFFQKPVELIPMNPFERRHIHMFLAAYDDVISESVGEGRDRRVVLKPKA